MPTDNKALLGVLNSSIFFFLFQMTLPKLQGDFFEPSYVYFKDFPLPSLEKLESLQGPVEQLLSLHSGTPAEVKSRQQQIRQLERDVDTLVYELYGLTEDEIALIESRVRNTDDT